MLNFLKGIAIIWIVLFHMRKDFPDIFSSSEVVASLFFKAVSYGPLAVNIFVIVSGFLLCRSYMVQGGKLNVRTFFEKRVLRLLPLYYLAIAFVLGMDLLIGSENFSLNLYSLFFHLAGLHNLTPYTFDLQGAWWFIALIVQLYILFPLLISAASRFNPWLIFALLIVFAVAARFVPYLNINSNYSVFRFLPDFYLGIFLAKYISCELDFSSYWGRISILIIAAFLAGTYIITNDLSLLYYGYGLFRSLISWGIFFVIVGLGQLLSHLKLSLPVNVISFFGIYSYSIYLFHRPFIYKYVTCSSPLMGKWLIICLFLLFILFFGVGVEKGYARMSCYIRKAQ